MIELGIFNTFIIIFSDRSILNSVKLIINFLNRYIYPNVRNDDYT